MTSSLLSHCVTCKVPFAIHGIHCLGFIGSREMLGEHVV